ncbi:MAG: VOC family protein [Gemmatimonadota bacterium]
MSAEHTSATAAPAPVITHAGTIPRTPHKLFVNIPVADVQRSIVFFEALGFAFNPQFTDASATCMLVGSDAYFMLLERSRFEGFSGRRIGDPQQQTIAMFALSVDSRAEVDEMLRKAVAAGGVDVGKPQDHGFMYGQAFYDLDGHHWELFWMDPATVNG